MYSKNISYSIFKVLFSLGLLWYVGQLPHSLKKNPLKLWNSFKNWSTSYVTFLLCNHLLQILIHFTLEMLKMSGPNQNASE